MNRNITSLILIALAVGIYFTYTKGVFTEAQAVKATNNQYVTAMNNAAKLIKTRDQVLDSFNKLSEDDRARLSKMVPSSVDNIRLIIDLNSVALRNGFSLKNIKATASKNSEGEASRSQSGVPNASTQSSVISTTLDTVTVTFTTTAPYQRFVAFLQELEASLRILDVKNLKVTSSDNGLYDFDVELTTYWLRQ